MNLAIIPLVALQVVAFGPGSRFQLEQSKDDFGMRSHGVIETQGANRTKFYPLPQSTAEQYTQLRPEDLRINPFTATADHYDRQEVIGPYQIEDGRIWFGNSYYDGEGMRGVGAFGYFDTATRSYTLFSPPDVARYEISAILVQPDWVWVGLDRFGEDIATSPGGLVRWNRRTHQIHKYPLEFVADSIRMEGDSLRLGTRDGYALFRDGEVHRFLTNGRPIAKFPLPPTIHAK
ncbi:MAG: hypothetical protein ABSG13_11575 [Bryobacteraceae bacterium]|jgi:hypothetical protein